MCKPVKIFDLAEKTIMLSGKELGKDIEIILELFAMAKNIYEELLNDQKNTIPTDHEKILKAMVSEYEYGGSMQ